MLSQVGMAQPAYDLPGRCHPDTKHSPDISLRGCSLVVVSLDTSSQVYHPDEFL